VEKKVTGHVNARRQSRTTMAKGMSLMVLKAPQVCLPTLQTSKPLAMPLDGRRNLLLLVNLPPR
jgi:hypothetical protein